MLRWSFGLTICVSEHDGHWSVQSHTVVFLDFHGLLRGRGRPGILEVDLVVASRQLRQLEVAESDPVTKVLLAECDSRSNLSAKHLRHDLQCLAAWRIHARVVRVRCHIHVHSLSRVKEVLLEFAIVILLEIVTVDPVFMVHGHDEVQERILEGLDIHEEHSVIQVVVRHLGSVIDADTRGPSGIIVIPLPDILLLTPWVAKEE